MNKAFVKEPDPSHALCPACQSQGLTVGPVTLAEHCSEALRRKISELAFFCASPSCPVVYYDAFERTVTCAEFGKPVYPKDHRAPLCPCFGLTCDDVEADLDEGAPTRVRALLQKARSSEARCQSLSPSGQSCLQEVQKYYLRELNRGS